MALDKGATARQMWDASYEELGDFIMAQRVSERGEVAKAILGARATTDAMKEATAHSRRLVFATWALVGATTALVLADILLRLD